MQRGDGSAGHHDDAPPDLGGFAGAAYEAVLDALLDRGEVVGAGDWATVLVGPDRPRWCVRVAPVDPAFRLVARDLLTGPPHRHLPLVDSVVDLAGPAYLVVMERLWVADAAASGDLLRALGHVDGGEPSRDAPSPPADAPRELLGLFERIEAVSRLGAQRYPRLWGGWDLHARDVMAGADGVLKVIDPVFLAGRSVAGALLAADPEPLAELSRAELEAFLLLPCFHRQVDRYDGVEELRAAFDDLVRRGLV